MGARGLNDWIDMKEIKQVVVIGSGRWAKVLASEIGKRFDNSVNIYFCAARRIEEIRQWANDQKHLRDIQVVDQLPQVVDQGINIAFVVNSAHEHEEAIKEALLKGYHVVAEKPLTISSECSQQVMELAQRLERNIFSTNTYRFASYLTDFKNLLPSDKPMTRLDIIWTDPAREERYGENKHYDPRVPIVMDVLPHIVSIFEVMGQFGAPSLGSLHLERGGAEVELDLLIDSLESHIQMSRASDQRKRELVVWQDSVCHKLDFSTEPGIVSAPHTSVIDPAWDSKLRPIASMLYSVINYFENGVQDSRLSIETAIKANRLIDSVLSVYRDQQGRFLSESFCIQNSLRSPDVAYALVESIQQSRKLTSENIELVLTVLEELVAQIAKTGDMSEITLLSINKESSR